MKYVHLFKTKSEHDAIYLGDNYEEPWLAYIKDDKLVTYNKPHDYSKDYFTIEALDDGNVYFKYLSFATTEDQRYIEYSKDGGNTWVRTTNVNDTEVIMTIPLLTGEKALVRGDNDTFCAYDEDEGMFFGSCFYSDIEFNVSGNIMSLIHGENFIGETNVVDYMFENLFFDLLGELYGIENYCMIVNAKNMILPATTLAESCYLEMFYKCTALTTAPELPATTLANNCYSSMFAWCISLITAPELPATTLTQQCYNSMFYGCVALTKAPELPATTLAQYCYNYMFYGCTNINYIKAMFTTTPSNIYTQNWVSGVASSGTFVKNSAATWNVTGVNGIPSDWTVQTASA